MRRGRSLLLFGTWLAACGGPTPAAIPPAPPPSNADAASPPSPAVVTVRRSVVSLGRTSGVDVTTTAADGTVVVAYDVHENGRGPGAGATVHLAPDGTIASLQSRGHHEEGSTTEETFSLAAGHATWTSLEEQGARDVAGRAFYFPITELPDTLGWLAQALLKAGGPIALLPEGEASLVKLGDATVTAAGQSEHLTCYGVTGLDFAPAKVWMKDDGSWFGLVSADESVVPEGWEAAIDPLVARQRDMDRARDQELAQRLAHRPPPAGLAFVHARVLDVEHGRWLVDHTVVVTGSTIAALGPSRTTPVPAGAETVDLAGKAVMPGLWDMHVHFGPADGPLHLASGVTTVRDVGSDPDSLDDAKARYDAGTAIGPHVLRWGFVEGRGPDAASSRITAETPGEAKDAVAFYAARGYEGIKLYNSIRPELIPIFTHEAHARGMKVTGHIPVHVLAHEAVEAGYDGIEHVNMLLLEFLADHQTETRTIARFTLVAEKGAEVDLRSKRVQDFFALLRTHHTIVCPTFETFEQTILGVQGHVVAGHEAEVARLPMLWKRSALTGGIPSQGHEAQYARSWSNIVHVAGALRDAGVTTVVGTDDIAGLSVPRELELFVQGGVTPAEALRDATLVPARAVGLGDRTGSIARGKTADLVVVDGDPLADVGDTRKVVTTVRGGVVYASRPLFEAVGVGPLP